MGVYQVPSCLLWGRGVTPSPPGLVLHLWGEAPISSLQNRLQRNFCRIPSPHQPWPPPLPAAPFPPAAWWRRGEGGELALRAQGLAFLPGGGERRVPVRVPRILPASPVGPRLSAAARCFLSEALATAASIWNSAQKRGPGGGGKEGRRPAASNGIRSPKRRGGEDRSGGGGGGPEASAAAPPPAEHRRGRPDIPGMVNTVHYALVNRLGAAQRLVLSIFSLALAFNLVSSGVCRGEDFISIG